MLSPNIRWYIKHEQHEEKPTTPLPAVIRLGDPAQRTKEARDLIILRRQI